MGTHSGHYGLWVSIIHREAATKETQSTAKSQLPPQAEKKTLTKPVCSNKHSSQQVKQANSNCLTDGQTDGQTEKSSPYVLASACVPNITTSLLRCYMLKPTASYLLRMG